MTKLTVYHRALACLFLAIPAGAAPVAVDDTYSTAEDTVCVPPRTPLVNATFNGGAEGWVYHSLLSGRRTVVAAPWAKGQTIVRPQGGEDPEHRQAGS